MPKARSAISAKVERDVLIEAGYRCAVPTCRALITLDIHHIEEVTEGGGNTLDNLIAFCPTCHALYTRNKIPREAINSWKTTLVALNAAFDRETIDRLLFLKQTAGRSLIVTGDGVLQFFRLIGAGLADYSHHSGFSTFYYQIQLTDKGTRFVEAWFSGSRADVQKAIESWPDGSPPSE